MNQQPFDVATNYKEILTFSKNLKEYVKANGLPFKLSEFPFEIKIDLTDETTGLGRLKKDLDCKRVLCVLGLKEDEDKNPLEFKVCFLALEGSGEMETVNARHKGKTDKGNAVDGEETWPPPDIITDPGTPLP